MLTKTRKKQKCHVNHHVNKYTFTTFYKLDKTKQKQSYNAWNKDLKKTKIINNNCSIYMKMNIIPN